MHRRQQSNTVTLYKTEDNDRTQIRCNKAQDNRIKHRFTITEDDTFIDHVKAQLWHKCTKYTLRTPPENWQFKYSLTDHITGGSKVFKR